MRTLFDDENDRFDNDPEYSDSPYGHLPGGNPKPAEKHGERWVEIGEQCTCVYATDKPGAEWSAPCKNIATVTAPDGFSQFGHVCEQCEGKLIEIESRKQRRKLRDQIEPLAIEWQRGRAYEDWPKLNGRNVRTWAKLLGAPIYIYSLDFLYDN